MRRIFWRIRRTRLCDCVGIGARGAEIQRSECARDFVLSSGGVSEYVATRKPQRRIYASDRRSDRRSSYGVYAVIILCFCFWRYGQLPVSRRSSAVGVAIPVTRSRSRSCHRDGGPGIITDLTRHGDFNLPVTRTLKLTRPAGRTR